MSSHSDIMEDDMLHRTGDIRSNLTIRTQTVWFVQVTALSLALVAAPPVSAHTTEPSPAVLDGGGGSKFAPSIASGADGLNVIAYLTGFGELKVAHCVDVQCLSATVSTISRRADFLLRRQSGSVVTGCP